MLFSVQKFYRPLGSEGVDIILSTLKRATLRRRGGRVVGRGGGGGGERGGVVIAWRETCAEREVSGQHSPRGRPFPRLSARLSACRGDSPAPVRPNTHRGTCPLVRGFRRAKTLTMQPVRLCGYNGPNTRTQTKEPVHFCGYIEPNTHTEEPVRLCGYIEPNTHRGTCLLVWLHRAKHSQRNLSACVVTSSQTLTEEPVCLCGYIEPNTHRGTCLLVWSHRAKHSQRNLSACVVISGNTQKSRNLTLTALSLFFFSFFLIVFLYGYTEPNIHKGTCPLV